MSVDSDLKKDGIVVKHMLSINTTNALADFVSDKISKAYSSYGFDKETLYNKVSNIPMYIANIPEGFSEASYFYKNSSIYFKENLSLDEMKKFAIHECIHYIQEVRDEKYNLYKLGLYDFATNFPQVQSVFLAQKSSCG